MPVAFKYIGDEQAAKNLRRFGQVQLDILINAMSYQGLQQNQRNVKFSDGTIISCKRVMNLDTVTIYVPTQIIPVEERVITEVTYCWCSRYFSEGTIIEVINPDSKEGEYPSSMFSTQLSLHYQSEYGSAQYYGWIFNIWTDNAAAYTGIRYKVKVCRGIETKNIICGSLSIAPHSVGDKVILFCAGNGNLFERHHYNFLPFKFKESPCYGKMNSCFSCNTILRDLTKDHGIDIEDALEGTYVITDLSITDIASPNEDMVDVLTYKYISTVDLEKDCLTTGIPYSEKITSFLGAIDFTNNTVQIKLNTDEVVTANIHFNCQAPYAYKDRARMLTMIKIYPVLNYLAESYGIGRRRYLVLKSKDNGQDIYTIIGYTFSMPARCPVRMLSLNFLHSDKFGYSYDETSRLIWDLENDVEVLNTSTETACLVKDGVKRLQEIGVSSDVHQTLYETTGIVGDSNNSWTKRIEGYYETRDTASIRVPSKISDDTYRTIRKDRASDVTYFWIPVKEKYISNYQSFEESNKTTNTYNKVSSCDMRPIWWFAAWYIDYSKEVYSIPGDKYSLPNYQYSEPFPITFQGEESTIYKDNEIKEETVTSYYDKDKILIFENNSIIEKINVGYGLEEFADDYITQTNELLSHTFPSSYSTCDNSVYLFDIYVTRNYKHLYSWSDPYWKMYPVIIEADTYNAYVIGYKQEGITDFSKFKLNECEKFSTGAIIDRIKEMAIDWQTDIAALGSRSSFIYSLDGFGIPNN